MKLSEHWGSQRNQTVLLNNNRVTECEYLQSTKPLISQFTSIDNKLHLQ